MLHALQNCVKQIIEEANNNIVELISVKTLELNDNKREYTLALCENMTDEKESLYFECRMRSVDHNLNIQPGCTPIHSQLIDKVITTAMLTLSVKKK